MSRRRQIPAPGCPHPEKKRFRDEAAAKLALARIAHPASREWHKTPTRAYRCACGGWHLTSQPAWDQRAEA